MKPASAIALLVALSGCAHRDKIGDAPPPQAAETRVVVMPRECGEINADALKPLARVEKAEGFIAESVDVAIARGQQVDVANERIGSANAVIARIAAILKKYGCLKVAR